MGIFRFTTKGDRAGEGMSSKIVTSFMDGSLLIQNQTSFQKDGLFFHSKKNSLGIKRQRACIWQLTYMIVFFPLKVDKSPLSRDDWTSQFDVSCLLQSCYSSCNRLQLLRGLHTDLKLKNNKFINFQRRFHFYRLVF